MYRCIRTSVAVLCGLIGVAGTGSAAEAALDFTHSFSRVGMSTNLFFHSGTAAAGHHALVALTRDC